VTSGKVDLPRDCKAGMENLLFEGLAIEEMRYTLELKEKQVKQSGLAAEAERSRREKAAEAAAGQEQIIAAKAQAEAMKHVLPFKQKQIEQRALEAEAEKVARIKNAEAAAQARRIEAAGEAESRQKLADAEAYRQERLGKIASEQLARDGALISEEPAADPEDAGRQALRQDLGDHRAAAESTAASSARRCSAVVRPVTLLQPADAGERPSSQLKNSSRRETDHACHRPHRHRHRHPGPVGAARSALGNPPPSMPCSGRATASKSAASQGRLPAGLRPPPRARRLHLRASQVRAAGAQTRERLPTCWPSCASCATRRERRRSASATPQPTSRRRRPRRSTAKCSTPSAPSPNASPAARRCAQGKTPDTTVGAHLEVARGLRESHGLPSSATTRCSSATTATRFAGCWLCQRATSRRRSRRSL
jgi:hypothetical protein